MSIINEAWEQRGANLQDQAEREQQESEPVDRVPTSGASIKPGWAGRVEFRQYWIHLTLYQPINERWKEEAGENWSRGALINDGIVKRGVTIEATTHLGRRALRIGTIGDPSQPSRIAGVAGRWKGRATSLLPFPIARSLESVGKGALVATNKAAGPESSLGES